MTPGAASASWPPARRALERPRAGGPADRPQSGRGGSVGYSGSRRDLRRLQHGPVRPRGDASPPPAQPALRRRRGGRREGPRQQPHRQRTPSRGSHGRTIASLPLEEIRRSPARSPAVLAQGGDRGERRSSSSSAMSTWSARMTSSGAGRTVRSPRVVHMRAERLLLDRGRGVVIGEVEADHEATSPHRPQEGLTGLERLETRAPLPHGGGRRLEVGLHGVDRDERRRTRDRVPAERRGHGCPEART